MNSDVADNDSDKRRLHNAFKRLLRKDSSRDPGTVFKNVQHLCDQFNEFWAGSVTCQWDSLDSKSKGKFQKIFAIHCVKLERCSVKSGFKLSIPKSIDTKIIILDEYKDSVVDVSNISDCDSSVLLCSVKKESTVMDNVELVRLASSILKDKFSGDVEQLEAFISNIELLRAIAPTANPAILYQYVNGKIEGKARNCIPTDCNNIESLIQALKSRIKPETSKVLESRLAAVRFDNMKLTTFSDEVEAIADKLTNALIVEGVSNAKALEMTVDKVVATCRMSARNDLVKSVLASSKFDHPKEVLSKFITEIADEQKDNQILAFRNSRQNFHRGNNRGNFRGRGSGYRGNRNAFYNSNGNFNNNNGDYYHNNNSGYYNGDNNDNNNNNNNGFQYRQQRGNSNRGNLNTGTRGRNNNHNIHVLNQENDVIPNDDN